MPYAYDQETIWERFQDNVNMTARELEKWLDTEESKSVGQKQGGDESTGPHQWPSHRRDSQDGPVDLAVRTLRQVPFGVADHLSHVGKVGVGEVAAFGGDTP